MIIKPFCFAIIMIAVYALETGVRAQNVYKCGSSYSQTPCADGQSLTFDDSRDAAQKRQTDQATRRTAKLANQLEKERMALEKQVLRARPVSVVKVDPVVAVSASGTTLTPKRVKTGHKKPQFFVAEIPGTEKKVVRQKKSKKIKKP